MCDHQAGSAWFVGHRWGRRCRDAAQNLLQTSTIDLGGFPLRRICGTERSTTFFFFFNSFVRVVSGWGQSVVRWGRGGGGKKKPKQTNKNPGSELKRRSKVDRIYFSLFWQQESIGKQSMAASQQSHIIINAPREASVDAPHSLRRWEITKADISIANFGSKHKENLFLRQ